MKGKKIYDKNDLSQFSAPLQNNEFKAFLIEKNQTNNSKCVEPQKILNNQSSVEKEEQN